jgi:hypothetical protein
VLEAEAIFGGISEIQRELELLKRYLIRNATLPGRQKATSLYGAVKGSDITGVMIDESKSALFRDLEGL